MRFQRGRPQQRVVEDDGAVLRMAGLKKGGAGRSGAGDHRNTARLDDRVYEKGVEVTDEQLAAVNITRDAFHGEWNYAVTPSDTKS